MGWALWLNHIGYGSWVRPRNEGSSGRASKPTTKLASMSRHRFDFDIPVLIAQNVVACRLQFPFMTPLPSRPEPIKQGCQNRHHNNSSDYSGDDGRV